MLKRQHHLQRNYGAGNVAAAGSIIEALGNVTPGIQMPALRRDMAEQGARIPTWGRRAVRVAVSIETRSLMICPALADATEPKLAARLQRAA